MIIAWTMPAPPTLPTDWMPDYRPEAPWWHYYRPRKTTPGGLGYRTGRPNGRPCTAGTSAKRKAQYRASKARAKARKLEAQMASKCA